jgi:hypothetical protein
LWKAACALITGAVEVPVAFLEIKAAEFKTRQQGHATVMAAAAHNAASIAGKSPNIGDRALEYFANENPGSSSPFTLEIIARLNQATARLFASVAIIIKGNPIR